MAVAMRGCSRCHPNDGMVTAVGQGIGGVADRAAREPLRFLLDLPAPLVCNPARLLLIFNGVKAACAPKHTTALSEEPSVVCGNRPLEGHEFAHRVFAESVSRLDAPRQDACVRTGHIKQQQVKVAGVWSELGQFTHAKVR